MLASRLLNDSHGSSPDAPVAPEAPVAPDAPESKNLLSQQYAPAHVAGAQYRQQRLQRHLVLHVTQDSQILT